MGALDDLLASKPTSSSGDSQNTGGALDKLLAEVPKRTVLDTAKDIGVSAAKGAVGVYEGLVGLGDLATGGRAGKLVQDAGIDLKGTQEQLDKWYSPAQQQANEAVKKANGLMPTLGAIAQNPSVIPHTIIESVPSMIGGQSIATGAMRLAPKLAPLAAGAIGEGVITAGTNAEQIRQQSNDGLLTPKQSAIAAGSGLLTGAITHGSGIAANKLGVGDVDTLLIPGAQQVGDASKGIVRRTLEGGLVEGGQETVQSAQEQAAANLALDKPIGEGVGSAAALGFVTGAGMGAPTGALSRAASKANVAPAENTNSAWVSPEFNVNTRQSGLQPWSNPAFNDVRNPALNPSGQAEQINTTVLQDEQQTEQSIQSANSTDNINSTRTDDAMASASTQPVEAGRIDSTGNNKETASESAQQELTPELKRAKFRQAELAKAREARGDWRKVEHKDQFDTADSFITGRILKNNKTFEEAKQEFESLYAQQQGINDNTARPETASTGTDSGNAITSTNETGDGLSGAESRTTDITANTQRFSQQVNDNEKEKAQESTQADARENGDIARATASTGNSNTQDDDQGYGRGLDGELGDRAGNGVSGLRGGLSEGERYLSGELHSDTDNAIPDELNKFGKPEYKVRHDADAIVRNRMKQGEGIQSYLDNRNKPTGITESDLRTVSAWEQPQYNENKNEITPNTSNPENAIETNINGSQQEFRQGSRKSNKQTAKPVQQVNNELTKAKESYPQVKALVGDRLNYKDLHNKGFNRDEIIEIARKSSVVKDLNGWARGRFGLNRIKDINLNSFTTEDLPYDISTKEPDKQDIITNDHDAVISPQSIEVAQEPKGPIKIGDIVTAIDKGGYSGKVTGVREYNGKQYITTEESGKRSFVADKVKLSDAGEKSVEEAKVDLSSEAKGIKSLRNLPIDTKEAANAYIKAFEDFRRRFGTDGGGPGKLKGYKPLSVTTPDVFDKFGKAKEVAGELAWQLPYETARRKYNMLSKAKWESMRREKGLPVDEAGQPINITADDAATPTSREEQGSDTGTQVDVVKQYPTEKAAKQAIKRSKDKSVDTHEAIENNGKWVIQPKTEQKPVQTESKPEEASEQELIDYGLLYHDRISGKWKYKFHHKSDLKYSNSKERAVEQAREALRNWPESERKTKAQQIEEADKKREEDIDKRYSSRSIEELEKHISQLEKKKNSLYRAGQREFNGGGRRTSAAVSAESARDTAQEIRDIEDHIQRRKAKEESDQKETKLDNTNIYTKSEQDNTEQANEDKTEESPNHSGRDELNYIFKQLGRNSYKSASAELKSEIDNHPDAELIKQIQKHWSDVLLDVGYENKEDSNKPNSKVFIEC